MKILLVTLVFIIPQIVTARIAETHKQCVKRYGEEITAERVERENGAHKLIISDFSAKGLRITVWFLDDLSICMTYRKEDGSDITISEAEYLNNANWGGKWQRMKRKDWDHNKHPYWSAIMDKDIEIGLTAYLRERRQLEYKTESWRDLNKAIQKGSAEQKLKGL